MGGERSQRLEKVKETSQKHKNKVEKGMKQTQNGVSSVGAEKCWRVVFLRPMGPSWAGWWDLFLVWGGPSSSIDPMGLLAQVLCRREGHCLS